MAKRSFQGRDIGGLIAITLVVAAFTPLALYIVRGTRAEAAGLPLSAALPDKVSPGTVLVVGDPLTQKVLEHNGWLQELPFHVQFTQLSGGPDVTEAFRANALDLGSAANIPPIHAAWVGIPVKIVAFRFRTNPLEHPLYVLGVAPGSTIARPADLRGKRIAYSPGQAQGAVVLRTLQKAGIPQNEVKLVDLPAHADTYIGALAARQIDAAPIGAGLQAQRYLDKYGSEGARVVAHGPFRDDASVLYVRDETLHNPSKAAAIRLYVRLWARAQKWIESHPKEWGELYYVKDQGLNTRDAVALLRESGRSDIPRNWTQAIAFQQDTIDFMARQMKHKTFDAHQIFDRRFETVAADAFRAS